MQMYSANIQGSNAYLAKARRELESLMQEKGMPALWFTLLAADYHWPDLHKLAVGDAIAANAAMDGMSETLKEKKHHQINTFATEVVRHLHGRAVLVPQILWEPKTAGSCVLIG
jgi:hypothetical protein